MSAPEFLEGHLSRVVWASEDSGYAVLRLRTADGEVVAVGELGSLATSLDEGEDGPFVTVEGRWEEHAVHGRQFRAVGYLLGSPRTERGLALYLASAAVHGVGPTLAQRLVDHFGLRTLAVLGAEPERLEEVPGIGAARASAIAAAWHADEEGRTLSVLLRGLGLSQRLVERIKRRYGKNTSWVVHREPYRLAEDIHGVGFRTADALARELGSSEDHPDRVRAALVHCLRAASGEGHCALPVDVAREAVEGLGVPVHGLEQALGSAEAEGLVTVERGPEGARWAWLAALHRAEVAVAAALLARLGRSRPVVPDLVERVASFQEVALDPDQTAAVLRALQGGAVVITGGPGTGKTTLVRVLVRAARERGERWLLASPTGRASRRLEEAAGAPASTIHRLLEYRPGEGGFTRNRSNPLDADGLVVDEVSMVDLQLMGALLEALPEERLFSLVLVGDADQLPSVGPGQVLRDLVDSGVVPLARLTRIHRQASESGIPAAAATLRGGRVPASGEHSGVEDFFLVRRDDAHHARDTVVQVVAERLPAKGYDPIDDVQVLSPMRRGPLGTEALNQALQGRLNPDGARISRGEREFRVGDRVICTRNRYDVEVFNGDIGRVVGRFPKGLVVDFDGRRVEWTWDELHLLELAYAITIHKSQGSEYPAVVLALHRGHHVMLRRNLVYTAVTRARRFLCAVGSPSAWQRAVEIVGGDERYTRLAARLRGELGADASGFGPLFLLDE